MSLSSLFRPTAIGAILLSALAAFAQGHAPGRILVKFKPSSLSIQRQRALDIVQGRVSREIAEVSVVELHSAGREGAMARAIANSPFVEFAEVDRRAQISGTFVPNDPWYVNWQKAFVKIQCPEAWAVTQGSPSVIVAIVDTGVDGAHPDLAYNMVAGWDVVRNRADASDVMGHGTKVAGIVGAVGNNGIGVASMTLSCKIMSVRVADETGSAYISDIAEGITWAADHGAKVANVSINCSDSSTVSNAAQYFDRKGGVCVIGAGNDGLYRNQQDDPYEVVVGAVDGYLDIYYWSNTGPYVDIVAPGANQTTYRGGTYGVASGTSISAPHVSGAAALLYSYNPDLTGQQVQDALKAGAMDKGDPGYDTTYGEGLVNPYLSLLALGSSLPDTTAPQVSFVNPTGGAVLSGIANATISAIDETALGSVTFKIDGAPAGTKYSAPFDWSVDTKALSNGGHRLEALALDQAGNASIALIDVSVSNSAPDTVPPTVSILSPADGALAGSRVDVTISYSDNIAVTQAELYVDGKLVGTNKTLFRVSTRKWTNGPHLIQARAVDASGNATWSQTVTVYRL